MKWRDDEIIVALIARRANENNFTEARRLTINLSADAGKVRNELRLTMQYVRVVVVATVQNVSTVLRETFVGDSSEWPGLFSVRMMGVFSL